MATETKVGWTPGPWKETRQVEQFDDSTLGRPYYSIDTDTANQTGNRHAAYLGRIDGLRGERQEANARLISKAPEMATMLKAIAIAAGLEASCASKRDDDSAVNAWATLQNQIDTLLAGIGGAQ